jgi:hypothetical protein
MGAKQSGENKTTSTVNTGPWEAQQPYLKDAFAQAQTNYGTNKNNQYYGGETVAPLTDAQNSALNTTIGIGSGVNQGVAAAGQNNADTLNGKYLDPNSNPYLKSTFDAAADDVTRRYQTATAPQTAGAMESAGRYGSGAYQNQVKNNEIDLGKSLGSLAANIYGGNYQTERGNQMTAAGQAGGINQAQYINPNAALGAGGVQQTQQQNVDNSAMAASNYNRDQPTNALNSYLGQIQGNYGQSGTNTQSSPIFTNPAATAAGGISSIASLAPLLMKSDRRLKVDIRPIGKSFDGQTLYLYRFLGEPNFQIGLMAQEVETLRPDAVVEIEGVKHVDYARALEAA